MNHWRFQRSVQKDIFPDKKKKHVWLVVEPTHLKNISQNGIISQIGVKIKNIWNHHLDLHKMEMEILKILAFSFKMGFLASHLLARTAPASLFRDMAAARDHHTLKRQLKDQYLSSPNNQQRSRGRWVRQFICQPLPWLEGLQIFRMLDTVLNFWNESLLITVSHPKMAGDVVMWLCVWSWQSWIYDLCTYMFFWWKLDKVRWVLSFEICNPGGNFHATKKWDRTKSHRCPSDVVGQQLCNLDKPINHRASIP